MAKVTGIENALRALGKAKKEGAIRIADGLEKCAGVVLRKSQKYVPRDTEALANSGHIEGGGVGMGAVWKVVYGGPSAPYALYVHENLEVHHDHPTCAKFIERAVRESRGTMSNIMKREVRGQRSKVIDGEVVK